MVSSSDKSHPEYQYLDLMQDILDNGHEYVDRGTEVGLRGVFGRQIRFDMSKGFPLLTTKKVYWKGVLHELYWFLSGQTNIKYLVDNNVHIWDDYPYKVFYQKFKDDPSQFLSKEQFVERIRTDNAFAEQYGNLKRIYGEMWRSWPTRSGRTIDQVGWIVKELKEDPYAKNLIVNSWNPEYLYTMATNEDACRFPICHNMYQVNQKGGKLNLQLYQRTADIFLGVPFNIGSYALLLQILCKVTGYEPGEYVHTFGDVHIYEDHVAQVKEQLLREPKPFPTLTISDAVTSIDAFRPEHAVLGPYDTHPPIKATLTVSGGFYDKNDTYIKRTDLAKK